MSEHEQKPLMRDSRDSTEKHKPLEEVLRDNVETIQLARLWMLRALLISYQNEENKVVQRGVRELTYVLADGKWPVSLSAVINTSEGEVSVGVRRISGKRKSAEERLRSNLVPVNMMVKDGDGRYWMIGNLVGRDIINTNFGIFACQLDKDGNPIFVGEEIPYRGVNEVMGMSEVPISSIFADMAQQEKQASEQELIEGLKKK